MKVGIVGSESAKFTELGEKSAKTLIRRLLSDAKTVISGGCHLGGIDAWAAELGREAGIEVIEHLPTALSWEFYKERNMKIAADSDIVYCISVDRYPPNYNGMRFSLCYHCKTSNHIKSGGCWTMKRAIKLGRIGKLAIVSNFESEILWRLE